MLITVLNLHFFQFSLFLVGTKADLVSSSVAREIEVEACKIANSMSAEFWSVSSKKNENVAEMFARIGSVCFDKVLSKESSSTTVIFLNYYLIIQN